MKNFEHFRLSNILPLPHHKANERPDMQEAFQFVGMTKSTTKKMKGRSEVCKVQIDIYVHTKK